MLTLIELDVMSSFGRFGGVLSHDIVPHEGAGTEQWKAARTTQHAADHVLGGFLQPVSDGVFEHLVPRHYTCRFQPNRSIMQSKISSNCSFFPDIQ